MGEASPCLWQVAWESPWTLQGHGPRPREVEAKTQGPKGSPEVTNKRGAVEHVNLEVPGLSALFCPWTRPWKALEEGSHACHPCPSPPHTPISFLPTTS